MNIGHSNRLSCVSEYHSLKKVLLCEPQHMTISEIINETQRYYHKENINTELAVKQHGDFVQALRDQGIESILLPHAEEYPEQVFTRDIGFTIGQQLFVSHMGMGIRQGEDNILIKWLKDHAYPFHNLQQDSIEGGDVMIDFNTVFIGVSGRTSKIAVKRVRELLPDYTVIPIAIERSYLHLDCVFNLLSPSEALVYSPALHQGDLKMLSARYELIDVTKSEQFTMGTNVLSIGGKRVFSLPLNREVNRQLRERGFEVIETDISEIIKSGGSFRCCTLPIVREEA
ncbi:dimethylarginine dimethylaminohydrolase family protein [Paenibacillus sp. GP183]|uniref:dimethylarginine dimethylaminohydrolase family protein n=1 Tax=Paenibacillus sp. GP183 TaxID=1882751 RepID=UPI000894E99E|nr:dimethylarginine dimethylaminohydrolase family protein [Paenibacillus sp. GP183]SEB52906.1 N-Dimethylarginine dimethylaminohydrolase [Paenibacillus sp. GP183]